MSSTLAMDVHVLYAMHDLKRLENIADAFALTGNVNMTDTLYDIIFSLENNIKKMKETHESYVKLKTILGEVKE